MALVLCTGIDDSLLATRKLVLERAGHAVITVTDEAALIAACSSHNFDVAVIGQAVSGKEKVRVAGLIRGHCDGVKILELVPTHLHKVIANADDWIEVPSELPPEFAERVTALAAR